MIFSSYQFLVFFLTVIFLILIIPGSRNRKIILLIASYLFYALWDYRFVLLILFSTLVDAQVGNALDKMENARQRKWLLFISVSANLGVLGFFKYFNFFIESAGVLLSQWGFEAQTLNIILPVGISFYTFQTMSYTIDIYRRELKPVDSFLDFALFVSFFPQLVAGPIVRAADFLPQLKRPVSIRAANVWAGSQIFIVGLFKKLMVADAVAPFVDRVFAYPNYYSSSTIWLAVIAYALQIYCDFSGYSDMAIGCARILGFHFDRNFYMPYLSKNITEFWRRWHISLSSWLRDYLYIPLGGNRKGNFRTYINLMITMLLGGLWHGASWNFVLWGGVHGLALCLHRMWIRSSFAPQHKTRVLQIVSAILTFLFVISAWVLFRAETTELMVQIYAKMLFIDPNGATWYYSAVFVAIILNIIGHIGGSLRTDEELVFFQTPYSYRAAFSVITVLLIIYLFAPTEVSPFIYFQF